MSRLFPPSYAPNAIATVQGWMDPKTKEVLVAISGLNIKQEEQAEQIIEPEVKLPEDLPVQDKLSDIKVTEEVPIKPATKPKTTKATTKPKTS